MICDNCGEFIEGIYLTCMVLEGDKAGTVKYYHKQCADLRLELVNPNKEIAQNN